MAEAAQASPAVASDQKPHSYLVFLLQVSRPGLWSTTALSYLMPLGHADFLAFRQTMAGVIFVALSTTGVLVWRHDIVDAEGKTDALNPRKGSSCLARAASENSLPFEMAHRCGATSRSQRCFTTSSGRASFVVVMPCFYWLSDSTMPQGIAWKGRPPFDVLIQASYLLVFVC